MACGVLTTEQGHSFTTQPKELEREHPPVDCVGLGLCWVLDVRLVQQLLDTQEDLKQGWTLFRQRRPPVPVLVRGLVGDLSLSQL